MLALTLAFIRPCVCPVRRSPRLLLPGAPSQSALLAACSLGRRGGRFWCVPVAALATAPTSALAERMRHPPTLARHQRRRDGEELRLGGSPHRRKVALRLAAAKAGNRDTGRGVPQGAPISPLLSNLYMRRFVLGWKKLGHAARFGAEVVNYADDIVVCCRHGAEDALVALRDMMGRLRLSVNEAKTRCVQAPDETFDFLGYTIGKCWSRQTGRAYVGTRPSRKVIQRLCREISDATSRRCLTLEAENRVTHLNRMMVGWANYFCLGPVSPAYRAVDAHAQQRLRRWLCKKHKVKGQGTSRYSDAHLYKELGLARLELRTRNLPWAKA